jgi:hypothetical protein
VKGLILPLSIPKASSSFCLRCLIDRFVFILETPFRIL